MWPYALAAGATILDTVSGSNASRSEARAAGRDELSALFSGYIREKGITEKRDRTLSSMRARAGASGVATEGSALEVMQASAGQAARDLVVSQFITQQEVAAAHERRKQARSKSKFGPIGGLLKLGGIAIGAATEFGKAFKAPAGPRFSDSDLQIYGQD